MARRDVNVCQNMQQRSTDEVKVKTRISLNEMDIDRVLWFDSLDVAYPCVSKNGTSKTGTSKATSTSLSEDMG